MKLSSEEIKAKFGPSKLGGIHGRLPPSAGNISRDYVGYTGKEIRGWWEILRRLWLTGVVTRSLSKSWLNLWPKKLVAGLSWKCPQQSSRCEGVEEAPPTDDLASGHFHRSPTLISVGRQLNHDSDYEGGICTMHRKNSLQFYLMTTSYESHIFSNITECSSWKPWCWFYILSVLILVWILSKIFGKHQFLCNLDIWSVINTDWHTMTPSFRSTSRCIRNYARIDWEGGYP